MAFMRKCDRCAKAYDSYNTACDRMQPNSVMFANLGDDKKYWQNVLVDLCPECMKELKNWWNEKGKNIDGSELIGEIGEEEQESQNESGDKIIKSQA